VATYKHGQYLQQNQHDIFDTDYSPGNAAPFAGIYRCMGCGREVGIAHGHVLPPQNHHEHTPQQGAIRWRLIAYADHNPK
jgi:hypothetical protein